MLGLPLVAEVSGRPEVEEGEVDLLIAEAAGGHRGSPAGVGADRGLGALVFLEEGEGLHAGPGRGGCHAAGVEVDHDLGGEAGRGVEAEHPRRSAVRRARPSAARARRRAGNAAMRGIPDARLAIAEARTISSSQSGSSGCVIGRDPSAAARRVTTSWGTFQVVVRRPLAPMGRSGFSSGRCASGAGGPFPSHRRNGRASPRRARGCGRRSPRASC